MKKNKNLLKDSFGRVHNYLRISLTERCNIRCRYCMPDEGILLSTKESLMTCDEVYTIAKTFVDKGVTKIRLTGGEPLIRKDTNLIMEKLSSLPVEIALTTNGVIIDRYIERLKKNKIFKINISLDSLCSSKNKDITRRNYFDRVYKNIFTLVKEGFQPKINCVLIKGFNDDEILKFIHLSKSEPLHIRFIEFMPFDGNKWDLDKVVSFETIMKEIYSHFEKKHIIKLVDAPNDTAKTFKIKGYKGTFAIISSVTNPFCDGCNRIRITANGQLKNCLFSPIEFDLLNPLRRGHSMDSVIEKAISSKLNIRSGMETLEQFEELKNHENNRSMIAIGG